MALTNYYEILGSVDSVERAGQMRFMDVDEKDVHAQQQRQLCSIRISDNGAKDLSTQLLVAVVEHDQEKVKMLLNFESVDAATRDLNGRAALHFACLVNSGSSKVIHELLAQMQLKKHINRKDDFGFAPIHYAAMFNYPKKLFALITWDADVNILDANENSLFDIAYQNDNWAVIDSLLEISFDSPDKPAIFLSKLKESVQWDKAIQYDCSVIFDYMIQYHQKDLISPVHSGTDETPLFYAVWHNSAVILSTILTNAMDDLESVGIDHKCKNGKYTPLLAACMLNHTTIARMLLEGGANVTDRDCDGASALHHAVANYNYDIVQILLQQEEIEIDALAYKNQQTALHICCEREDMNNMAELLIRAGADVNLCLGGDAGPGLSPLLLSIMQENIELTQTLIANGANVDHSTHYFKETALHYAVQFENADAIQMLVMAKCDINAQDCLGRTALHMAGFHGMSENARFLLNQGARLDIRDIDGLSALSAVAYYATIFNFMSTEMDTNVLRVSSPLEPQCSLHKSQVYFDDEQCEGYLSKRLPLTSPREAVQVYLDARNLMRRVPALYWGNQRWQLLQQVYFVSYWCDQFYIHCTPTLYQHLGTVLKEGKSSFSEFDRFEVLLKVALGLSILHLQDIRHGNIRPESIEISKDNDVMIHEYGLLWIVNQFNKGTDPYIAPEMLSESAHPSKSADVFSFACVAIDVLSTERFQRGKKSYEFKSFVPQGVIDLVESVIVHNGRPSMVEVFRRLMNEYKKFLSGRQEDRLNIVEKLEKQAAHIHSIYGYVDQCNKILLKDTAHVPKIIE